MKLSADRFREIIKEEIRNSRKRLNEVNMSNGDPDSNVDYLNQKQAQLISKLFSALLAYQHVMDYNDPNNEEEYQSNHGDSGDYADPAMFMPLVKVLIKNIDDTFNMDELYKKAAGYVD